MTPKLIIVVVIAALIGYVFGRRSGRAAEMREQGPRAQPRPVRRPAPRPHVASEPHDHSDWGPVIDALRAGQKINAIKIYREMTGAGLRESKDFVEALARERGIR